MLYQDFKNIHPGSKIVVCGCGVSAPELGDPTHFITIGVNDIQRLYSTNYLVVVNDKASFDSKGPDRWYWIENAKAPYTFTHIKGLKIRAESKVLIQLGKYGGCDLDKPAVDYSNNSPYIGVIIAAHLGATHIGLIGVDFLENHFFAKTGEHVLNKRVNSINDEYKKLHAALTAKGIGFYNLSSISKIDIPKISVDDFAKM